MPGSTLNNFGKRVFPTIHRKLFSRYIRPHNYNIAVGTTIANLSPNQQRTPVRDFLVQSDLSNAGVINIGDGHVSLVNGIQLDPGRAWVFSVNDNNLASSMLPGVTQWADAMHRYGDIKKREEDSEYELYLDIADFFAISDLAAQNVRIYWETMTR